MRWILLFAGVLGLVSCRPFEASEHRLAVGPGSPRQVIGVDQLISLQIYRLGGISEGSYEKTVAEHHGYLSGFVDLLKSKCQIEGAFDIPPIKDWAIKPGSSRFTDPKHQVGDGGGGGGSVNFPFKFYQRQLYEMLSESAANSLADGTREGAILMAESLDGHCGFSLPEVQFTDVPKSKQNSKIIQLLKNRILLSSAPQKRGVCTNRRRILFHELGHIFVQDSPPHTCVTAEGVRRLCTKENLMASVVWAPAVRRPGGRRADSRDLDDSQMRQIDAQGVELNREQCAAIAKTIADVVDRSSLNFQGI